MQVDQKPVVTITGVTGFVGSYVCKLFLEHGGFQVRGTVRDVNNTTKVEPIKKAVGEQIFSQLELVNADLMDAQSVKNALAGSTHIVHVASPFFYGS